MKYDNADLHPEHARQILEIAVSMWTLFHIVLVIKLALENNWFFLLILVPFIIMNIWCVVRIIKFYK